MEHLWEFDGVGYGGDGWCGGVDVGYGVRGCVGVEEGKGVLYDVAGAMSYILDPWSRCGCWVVVVEIRGLMSAHCSSAPYEENCIEVVVGLDDSLLQVQILPELLDPFGVQIESNLNYVHDILLGFDHEKETFHALRYHLLFFSSYIPIVIDLLIASVSNCPSALKRYSSVVIVVP